MDYTQGVYGYLDTETMDIVYIGIDDEIRKSIRHKQHMYPSKRKEQEINAILQDAPEGKYAYIVLATAANKEFAYFIETALINALYPVYNIKKRTLARKDVVERMQAFTAVLGDDFEDVITEVYNVVKKKQGEKNENIKDKTD